MCRQVLRYRVSALVEIWIGVTRHNALAWKPLLFSLPPRINFLVSASPLTFSPSPEGVNRLSSLNPLKLAVVRTIEHWLPGRFDANPTSFDPPRGIEKARIPRGIHYRSPDSRLDGKASCKSLAITWQPSLGSYLGVSYHFLCALKERCRIVVVFPYTGNRPADLTHRSLLAVERHYIDDGLSRMCTNASRQVDKDGVLSIEAQQSRWKIE
jgi:hypothetical protein